MIPVLDWQGFGRDPEGFLELLGQTCRVTGFFLLTGHTVPQDLIARVFSASDTFFALPNGIKERYAINQHNRGWAKLGSESLDDASGEVDQKEAFNVGLDLGPDDPRVLRGDPFRAVNVWPDIEGFEETLLEYYDALWRLSVLLHRPIARNLGLSEDFFDRHFDAPLATLRLLTYPPVSDAEGQIGAGAHTDYGSITLLMTDGEAGLQVRPRGRDWMDVPHVEGAFVVNIGDCLMRWTNDTYVSTPHRVLLPKRRRRSIAFFLDPNPNSIVAALPGTGVPRYAPISGANYLRARLDATYDPETIQ